MSHVRSALWTLTRHKNIRVKQASTHVLILSVIQRGALQTHCLQHWDKSPEFTAFICKDYAIEVLGGHQIKLIQTVSNSEFDEYYRLILFRKSLLLTILSKKLTDFSTQQHCHVRRYFQFGLSTKNVQNHQIDFFHFRFQSVIIQKSCREVSPVEQYTNDCECLAYLRSVFFMFLGTKKIIFFLKRY